MCTSRVEGGGGAGATREALSSGGRAGAGGDNPGGGRNSLVGGGEEGPLGFGGNGSAKLVKSLSRRWKRCGGSERESFAGAGRASGRDCCSRDMRGCGGSTGSDLAPSCCTGWATFEERMRTTGGDRSEGGSCGSV